MCFYPDHLGEVLKKTVCSKEIAGLLGPTSSLVSSDKAGCSVVHLQGSMLLSKEMLPDCL